MKRGGGRKELGDRKPRVVSWCNVDEKRRGSGRRLAIGDARGTLEIYGQLGRYRGPRKIIRDNDMRRWCLDVARQAA